MVIMLLFMLMSNIIVSLLLLDVMVELIRNVGGKVDMDKRMFGVVVMLVVVMLFIVKVYNTGTIKAAEYINVEYENVKLGDIIEFEFGRELQEEDLDLDGLSFIGCSSGVCRLEALRDMDIVEIVVESGVVVGRDKIEHESGEGGSINGIGEGDGSVVDWGDVELGKHVWYDKGELIYAIRLDLSKYKGYDKIYVYDKSEGLEYCGDMRVSILYNDGVVVNGGSAEYKVVEWGDDYFILEIDVGDEMDYGGDVRYDIVYRAVQIGDKVNNEYTVYSLAEYEDVWVNGKGGGVAGESEGDEDETVIEDDKGEGVIEKESEDEDKIDDEEDEVVEEDDVVEEDKEVEEENTEDDTVVAEDKVVEDGELEDGEVEDGELEGDKLVEEREDGCEDVKVQDIVEGGVEDRKGEEVEDVKGSIIKEVEEESIDVERGKIGDNVELPKTGDSGMFWVVFGLIMLFVALFFM